MLFLHKVWSPIEIKYIDWPLTKAHPVYYDNCLQHLLEEATLSIPYHHRLLSGCGAVSEHTLRMPDLSQMMCSFISYHNISLHPSNLRQLY